MSEKKYYFKMLLNYMIALDYYSPGRFCTWPRGRWCRNRLLFDPGPLFHNKQEDARLVFLSYVIIAQLRVFEQVFFFQKI